MPLEGAVLCVCVTLVEGSNLHLDLKDPVTPLKLRFRISLFSYSLSPGLVPPSP